MAMSGKAFIKWVNEHNAGAEKKCKRCGKKTFSSPCPECQQDEYYERMGNELEKNPLARASIKSNQKRKHDGDCTIYMSLNNEGRPEAGICTCGYGWSLVHNNDWSQMYSKELKRKLKHKGAYGNSKRR